MTHDQKNMAKKQNTKSTAKRTTKRPAKKRDRRSILRTVALALTVVALGIGGVLGGQWTSCFERNA